MNSRNSFVELKRRKVYRVAVAYAVVAWLLNPAMAFLLVGCGETVHRSLEQTIEQSYKIDPTVSLSIRNPDGVIRIYGSSAAELKLKAIKKASSTDRLNGIIVAVTPRPDSISIETKLSPQKKFRVFGQSETVDYTLVVPETTRILRLDLGNGDALIDGMRGGDARVNVVNGRLTAHNCFGELRLAVASGALDVLYDWWEQRIFSINAQVTIGNARVLIPRGGSFHVVAETKNGEVTCGFTESVQLNGHGTTKIDRSIGAEVRADIEIRVTDGNIKIAQAIP